VKKKKISPLEIPLKKKQVGMMYDSSRMLMRTSTAKAAREAFLNKHKKGNNLGS